MDAAAVLRGRIAVAGHRHQAIDEVGRRRGDGIGSGSQRSWLGGVGTSIEAAFDAAVVDAAETARARRPGGCGTATMRRLTARGAVNAGTRQLLGVETVRRALRRILTYRATRRAALRSRTRCRIRIGSSTAASAIGLRGRRRAACAASASVVLVVMGFRGSYRELILPRPGPGALRRAPRAAPRGRRRGWPAAGSSCVEQRALRLGKIAVRIDQLLIEVVGRRKIGLGVERRHAATFAAWTDCAVARAIAARTAPSSNARQRAQTCWSGRNR